MPPAAIASHIHFLASDVLEGRETGMRGFDVAAEYDEQRLFGETFGHRASATITLR